MTDAEHRTASSSPAPEEVRAARLSAGMTQTQAGASLKAWQHWEAGTRRMHPAFWELSRIKAGQRGGNS